MQRDATLSLDALPSPSCAGPARRQVQAKRGDSRDKRPDGQHVLGGLVLDRDGFPKAPEGFAGTRQGRSTLPAMLVRLEKRPGQQPGATVGVDRGLASAETLAQIQAHGLHDMVAGRPAERTDWRAEGEEADWSEGLRTPSPRHPAQKKSQGQVQLRRQGNEGALVGLSEGRQEQEGAIRATPARRLWEDVEAWQPRIAQGPLRQPDKLPQAIGRLQERDPRVARSDRMADDARQQSVSWQEETAQTAGAAPLEGRDVLKTDRHALTADESGRTSIGLTRGEAALRAMQSPLRARPIFHHVAAADGNAPLPGRTGLPSARRHGETVRGHRHAHGVGDPPPPAQHAPGGPRRAANPSWADSEDAPGHHPGANARRDLPDAPPPQGSHEAREDLARARHLVTEWHWQPA